MVINHPQSIFDATVASISGTAVPQVADGGPAEPTVDALED
jgi:hypothetical protein